MKKGNYKLRDKWEIFSMRMPWNCLKRNCVMVQGHWMLVLAQDT